MLIWKLEGQHEGGQISAKTVERRGLDCPLVQSVVPMQELLGHEGSIHRLVWSEDGFHLASASDDRRSLPNPSSCFWHYFSRTFFFLFVEFICFDVAFYNSYAFIICSAAIEAMVLCGYEGSMFCVETPSFIHFVYCGQDIIVAILVHKLRWAKSIVVSFSRSWLCDRILVSMV